MTTRLLGFVLLVTALSCAQRVVPDTTASTPAAPREPFALIVPSGADAFALRLRSDVAPPRLGATFDVVEVASGKHLRARASGPAKVHEGTFVEVPVSWLGTALEPSRLGVALLGAGDPPPRPEQFRECASAEGVHITLWSGAPLTTRRLWHAYWDAGYDLDPTCEPQETAADVTDAGQRN